MGKHCRFWILWWDGQTNILELILCLTLRQYTVLFTPWRFSSNIYLGLLCPKLNLIYKCLKYSQKCIYFQSIFPVQILISCMEFWHFTLCAFLVCRIVTYILRFNRKNCRFWNILWWDEQTNILELILCLTLRQYTVLFTPWRFSSKI